MTSIASAPKRSQCLRRIPFTRHLFASVSKINVFDPQVLKNCCAQRPDYPATIIQTREGLATYYEGMALRKQLVSYPAEDADKFTWRRERMLELHMPFVREVSALYLEGVFRTKSPERTSGIAALDVYLSDKYERWFLEELAPFSLFLDEVFVTCTVPEATGVISS